MSSGPRSRPPLAGAVLLALLIVALPLAHGGVGFGAHLAAATIGLLALGVATWRAPILPASALALGAVLVVCVFQLLPLPVSLHGLSPEAQKIFESSLKPLGRYPAARPLTLDPAASGRALVVEVAGFAAFWSAFAWSETRRRRNVLVGGLALSAVLVSGAVLGLAVLGVRPFLAPTAPFVNPNHLAGFLLLTAFPLLGLALRSTGQARLLWLLGFVLSGSVILLSLSRGGIGALFGGVVLFVALSARRDRPEAVPERRGRWAFTVGITGALAAAAYLALSPVLAELRTLRDIDRESKLDLWIPALKVLRDFPLVGVGRGGFETAFAAYKTGAEQVTYTHIENEWLQAPVDLGAPAGVLLLGALVWTWLAAARRRDLSTTEVGLLAGTGALAAQNLVDFSLELGGVAVPFMVALGLLARGARPLSLRPWVARAGVAAMAIIACGGAAVWISRPGSEAPFESRIAWRPADFVPPALEGARLVHAGQCAGALPWLTRAMLLSPSAPEPHIYAARCLAAGGQPSFAKREYRLALMSGSSEALREALRRFTAYQDLTDVVPVGADGLLLLGRELRDVRPEDAERALRTVLDEYGDGRALLHLSEAVMNQGRNDEAIGLARRRSTEEPRDVEAWRQTAWFLIVSGRQDEARDVLQQGLAIHPGAPSLVQVLAELSMRARPFGEARQIAEQMASRTPAEAASKQLLIARILAGQGRLSEAVERARSAASAQPDEPGPLLAIVQLSEGAGRYEDAIAALERLRELPGQRPDAHEDRLIALQAALRERQERRQRAQLVNP